MQLSLEITLKVETLEGWVSTPRTWLDLDMEDKFQHWSEASEELTGILMATNIIGTSTAEAQNIKRAISE